MSYSYVKTVFPNFEFSTIHNDQLYTDLKPPQQLNVIGFNTNEQNELKQDVNAIDPIQTNIETYKNNQSFPIQKNVETYQSFYNKPIINQDIPNYNNINVENFNNSNSIENKHDNYINHINNCSSCKEILIKQFNIETERIKNEEIMELISYVIFGIFIFFLLDSFKK
jgi:hypothetical protein